MLHVRLDREKAIAILEPEGALSKEDFDNAVKLIDPFIEEHGKLNGVIIYTKSFPGWKSFAALSRHITFIKNHHKEIKRLAFVTDSIVGDLAENITGHFVEAEIKSFAFEQLEEAKTWIAEA
jgi:hypothetical protein